MLMAAANILSQGVAGEINTAYYAQKAIYIGGQSAGGVGNSFSSDGTKAYITRNGSPSTIYQYTLAEAWDASTGSYASKSLDVSAQDTGARDVAFSSDGTKAYIAGSTNNTIFQYTLSTAWDISTGSYASKSLSVSAQNTGLRGLAFSPDGTKAYITGTTATASIFQYTLSTAWDISTGSYASKSLDVSAQDTNIRGLDISSDGTRAYITGATAAQSIYQYNLTTAFDISTGAYSNKRLITTAENNSPQAVFLKPDGTIAYMTGANVNYYIYQYNLT